MSDTLRRCVLLCEHGPNHIVIILISNCYQPVHENGQEEQSSSLAQKGLTLSLRIARLLKTFYEHIYSPIRQTQTEKYRYIYSAITVLFFDTNMDNFQPPTAFIVDFHCNCYLFF